MDDTTWARVSVGGFQASCKFLVLQDRKLYSEGRDGELEPPSQILGKMCPSDCSGHGICAQGICGCDNGIVSIVIHFF